MTQLPGVLWDAPQTWVGGGGAASRASGQLPISAQEGACCHAHSKAGSSASNNLRPAGGPTAPVMLDAVLAHAV